MDARFGVFDSIRLAHDKTDCSE